MTDPNIQSSDDIALLRRAHDKMESAGRGMRVDYRNRGDCDRLAHAGLCFVRHTEAGDGYRSRLFVTSKGRKAAGIRT